MESAIKGVPGTKRLYTYHGHRENLYAIAELLHLELSDIGIPKTAILPAATIFLELYRRDEAEQQQWESDLILEQEQRKEKRESFQKLASSSAATESQQGQQGQQEHLEKEKQKQKENVITKDNNSFDINNDEDFYNFDTLTPKERRKFGDDGAGIGVEREYFVRAYFWRPCPPDSSLCRPFRKQIRIHDCEMNCPFAQVKLRVHRHIQRTGTWQTLCNFPNNSDMYRDTIVDNAGIFEHKTVPYFTKKWWALQKLKSNPWIENVQHSPRLEYLLDDRREMKH